MEKPSAFDPRGQSDVDPRKLFYFDPSKVLTGGVIFILPCYVAFVTTEENETFYGELQTFKTGEIDPDGIIDIDQLPSDIELSVYDLNGRQINNGSTSNRKLPRGITSFVMPTARQGRFW